MYVYAISRRESSVPVYRKIAIWLSKGISDNYLPRNIIPSKICLINHFFFLDDFLFVLDEFRGESLYSFLKKNFSIKLERKESLVSSALPTFDEATQLLMLKSEPVLKSKSVNIEITTGGLSN